MSNNIANHAGTRRSERRTANPTNRAPDLRPEEDARFPGYKTVIVPRTNPRDARAASPIGEYRGRGYKELSTDPEMTGHEDNVLMGVPIDVWEQRERERSNYHNGLMKGHIGEGFEDMPDEAGENVKIFIDRSQSGLKTGEKQTIEELGATLPVGPASQPNTPVDGD